MQIRPIQNDDDLTWALGEIDRYFNAELGSPEGAYMEALATLAAAYEDKHYPIPPVSPVEMIRFSMEQNDRSQKDLAAVIGSRSRASEILSGKRPLTLDQIRRIHKAWRIPIACLVGELEDA